MEAFHHWAITAQMVRRPGERVPTGFGLHGLLPLIALTTHILAVVRTAKVATLTNQDR